MLHSLESKARNLKNLDFPRGRGGQSLLPLFRFMKRWKDGENRNYQLRDIDLFNFPDKENIKQYFYGVDTV